MVGSSQLYAQDLLSSTGTATRSYSFVEFQYLPEIAKDTDELPIRLSLIAAVTDSISLTGRYQQAAFADSDNAGNALTAEIESIQGGVLYHQEFPYLADSDWVAGLSVGRNDSTLRATTNGVTVGGGEATINFQEAYVGLRRSFTDKIEGEAGLVVFRTREDTDVSGSIRVVYRLLDPVDIAVAVNEIGGDADELFGIGLRYTW